MNVAKRILGILTEPAKFFDYAAKKEKGIKTAFWYYATIMLIGSFLGTVATLVFPTYNTYLLSTFIGMELPPQPAVPVLAMAAFALLGYVLGLAGSFIGAALLHGWCLIFGGKGDYAHSYQLLAYSSTAKMTLGWIPFVNLFVWIWSLILLIIGTEKLHKVSRRRATVMYLIPAALMLIFAIIMLVIAVPLLQTLPAEAMIAE
jgi:hypothetical protein